MNSHLRRKVEIEVNPQMKLNLCGRELDQEVKYNVPHKAIRLNSSKKEENNFLTQDLKKEVKGLSLKNKRKMLRICKLTTASISFFMLGTPVFAQTPGADVIMPTDIMKIGMYLIGICAVASTILAIILGQFAGAYRMMRKKKEATEWTDDILRGYAQTILAPVIIITIALVAYLLFGNFEWFVKPF
jgi:hypothetical protein